ncbi:MAG: hypothetical protein AAGF56_03530 [Pseudomonadota bacterium]
MTAAGIAPYLYAFGLFCAATLIGILPVKKLIQVREAKHELTRGSAGFIRTISGWSVIMFWVAATWFVATILGDWATYGDLEAAMERGFVRLRVLLEILAALAED